MRRRDVLAAFSALPVSKALSQSSPDQATHGRALSGDRFTSLSEEFALADVIAPPLYSLSADKPAHFNASTAALQDWLSSAETLTVKDALPPTKWGVRRVIAERNGGDVLQESLVVNGAVRVMPQSQDHEFIQRLLMLESKARAERRGLWALPDYRVFNADNAYGAIGDFHLIEGTLVSAEKHGARFYLNFGEDYRTDFTAGAANRLYNKWLMAGTDLAALQDAKLRIRGFVDAINGPSVDLKHPLQVEQLA